MARIHNNNGRHLFDSGGLLDRLSATLMTVYSFCAFLTWGVHADFMQNLMPKTCTLFGTLTTGVNTSYGYNVEHIVMGGFSLGVFLTTWPAVIGDGHGSHHLTTAGCWLGCLMTEWKYFYLENKGGGIKDTMNTFWLFLDVLFVYLHFFRWIDVPKKLKLA